MDLVNLMKSMSMEDAAPESTQSNFHVFAVDINGHHTDIVFGEFSHKYMVRM